MAATTEYASVLRSVLGFKNKRRNVTLTPKYIAVEDISSAPESGIIVVESNRSTLFFILSLNGILYSV